MKMFFSLVTDILDAFPQVMLWRVTVNICNEFRALLNEVYTILAMIRHAWILHACMNECMDKLKEGEL